MLPIILDPKHVKALVIGSGPATERRLQMLKDANVKNFKHFESIPVEDEFDNVNILYVADFDDEISERIYQIARRRNIFINTEDKTPFCDFHAPAIVRRGDLLLTVSTAGKGPRLARRIKRILENMFGLEWKDNLDQLSKVRDEYKIKGYKFETLATKIDEEIEDKKMFRHICDRCMK